MRTRKPGFFGRCLLTAVVVMSLTGVAAAAGQAGDVSIGVSGQYAPFLSGYFVPDNGTSYSDAFKGGWGFNIEAAYRFDDMFSAQFGFGWESYAGKTVGLTDFDNLNIVPIYVGGKIHLPVDRCWDPYFRVDLGAARYSSVDATFLGVKTAFIDPSWGFLTDFGPGLEYKMGNVGIFTEVKARYIGSPSSSGGRSFDPDGNWTFPINLGVRLYF
ncbi:MAG: outer membrane beta-barrel protein [Deltaproteobacteria bacterium]|nr:outer membrane beta-barrel protein [Deltaproteobacteria bacterium]